MKVVWQGFFDGNTGYINATKIYPLATRMAGYDVGIVPMRQLHENDPLNQLVVQERKPDHFHILHQIPNWLKADGYFTVTEFDLPPPEWWQNMNSAEIIMTQSDFCIDTFSKIPDINKEKIHKVYAPVDTRMSVDGPKMTLNRKADFVFGSCFTWVDRKVPELMWQAFRDEFPIQDYPNILFVNKINVPPNFSNWKWVYNVRKQDKRIVIKPDYYDDIGTFYRGLDCYLSPTAGEGFGLTLAEAMSCGIPTIASRHSGNLEFMNDDNSWLCGVDDWSYLGAWDRHCPIGLNHDFMRWKLPKVESIRQCMRDVYNGKRVEERIEKALEVKEMCSIQNISTQIKGALKWLEDDRERRGISL